MTQAGQTAAQQVGSLQLALFNNPGGLNSTGSNLLLATTASGDPILGTPGGSEGLGTIQQGMLEQSNVSVVDEFVSMIVPHGYLFLGRSESLYKVSDDFRLVHLPGTTAYVKCECSQERRLGT